MTMKQLILAATLAVSLSGCTFGSLVQDESELTLEQRAHKDCSNYVFVAENLALAKPYFQEQGLWDNISDTVKVIQPLCYDVADGLVTDWEAVAVTISNSYLKLKGFEETIPAGE